MYEIREQIWEILHFQGRIATIYCPQISNSVYSIANTEIRQNTNHIVSFVSEQIEVRLIDSLKKGEIPWTSAQDTATPSSALSNFAPHPFTFRGMTVNSMEGFLQGLKFKNPEMQKHVFTAAKFKGKKKNWQERQTLWMQGQSIDRHSKEYQDILDEAYKELSKNTGFQKALLASGDAVFEHSIGKSKESDTVLTRSEFCSRLTRIRAELKRQEWAKGAHLWTGNIGG